MWASRRGPLLAKRRSTRKISASLPDLRVPRWWSSKGSPSGQANDDRRGAVVIDTKKRSRKWVWTWLKSRPVRSAGVASVRGRQACSARPGGSATVIGTACSSSSSAGCAECGRIMRHAHHRAQPSFGRLLWSRLPASVTNGEPKARRWPISTRIGNSATRIAPSGRPDVRWLSASVNRRRLNELREGRDERRNGQLPRQVGVGRNEAVAESLHLGRPVTDADVRHEHGPAGPRMRGDAIDGPCSVELPLEVVDRRLEELRCCVIYRRLHCGDDTAAPQGQRTSPGRT